MPRRTTAFTAIFILVVGLLLGSSFAGAASHNDTACRKATVSGSVSTKELLAYVGCREDKQDAALARIESKLAATTPSPTPKPSPSASPSPTKSTTSPSPTPTPTGSTPPAFGSFPTAATTGVSSCPALTKVNNGDEVAVTKDGAVIQNVEYLNPVVLNIRSSDVTVRCVKFNGTGYFGIDNTVNNFSSKNLTVDQVDISCKKTPQVIGMLLQSATVTRVNAHDCDHMVNVAGDKVTIADSYCHDLTDAEPVHADCVQDTGGHDGTTIRGNAFYSRDTSDVLLGQEGGDSKNVVIDRNLFSSTGTPAPAYLLYLSGTNTKVTNNVFTRERVNGVGGHTYGAVTVNTNNPFTWSGNTWADDGSTFPSPR